MSRDEPTLLSFLMALYCTFDKFSKYVRWLNGAIVGTEVELNEFCGRVTIAQIHRAVCNLRLVTSKLALLEVESLDTVTHFLKNERKLHLVSYIRRISDQI